MKCKEGNYKIVNFKSIFENIVFLNYLNIFVIYIELIEIYFYNI